MDLCQSCGMPLRSDPKGGGTNADGTISLEYCSYCWENGKFLNPTTDAKEFQKAVYNILRHEQKMPVWKAWLLTISIPYQKRWKS
ncbi:MAG: zinc ribbon domain-containing protein [Brevinema sp.]